MGRSVVVSPGGDPAIRLLELPDAAFDRRLGGLSGCAITPPPLTKVVCNPRRDPPQLRRPAFCLFAWRMRFLAAMRQTRRIRNGDPPASSYGVEMLSRGVARKRPVPLCIPTLRKKLKRILENETRKTKKQNVVQKKKNHFSKINFFKKAPAC